jgi:hypothetical protein
MFTYLILTANNKIPSIKHYELSSVVTTVHGRCWRGGCMCSLECLIGLIPMLVFPICGFTTLTLAK